jgi:hypothetical protein
MKKLLRQVFFWDSSAQGAFFGLTLAGIGTWLLLSIFHFLWTVEAIGWIGTPIYWESPQVVTLLVVLGCMLLYALFLIVRFYGLIACKSMLPRKIVVFLAWVLFAIILAAVLVGWVGSVVACAIFLGVALPLWLPGINKRLLAIYTLCLSLGLLICALVAIVIYRLMRPFDVFFAIESPLPSSAPWPLNFLPVSGSGWPWFFALGTALLLVAYLLIAQIWSQAAKLPNWQIFGRAVLVLWLLFALNYLAQLFLAYRGVQEARQAVSALEGHFARPMTAQALGELYYNGEQPDSDFWEKETALYNESNPFADDFNMLTKVPAVMPPELMQLWRQHLASKADVLSQWEEMFSGDIPPGEQSFEAGSLVNIQLQHLSHFRQLNRLSLWRVQLALAEADISTALAANERQANANKALSRETHLISALVWSACTKLWLDTNEMLLESKLLTDEQLLALDAQLGTIEKQLLPQQQRALYSEVVCLLDTFDMLTMRPTDVSGEEYAPGFSWRDFRYFIPQLWWYAALDKAYLARSFLASRFSEVRTPLPGENPPLLFSRMFLPPVPTIASRFDELAAKLRAMRALIMAEQYRREHGNWPTELENLPADPFTAEPMRYRHGNYDIEVDVVFWCKQYHRWRIEKQKRNVPVVQVWSVGPNQIDDSAPQAQEQPERGRSDDVYATLRLQAIQP